METVVVDSFWAPECLWKRNVSDSSIYNTFFLFFVKQKQYLLDY